MKVSAKGCRYSATGRGSFDIIRKVHVKRLLRLMKAIGVFTRAIGNGKADNMVLVGVDTTKENY